MSNVNNIKGKDHQRQRLLVFQWARTESEKSCRKALHFLKYGMRKESAENVVVNSIKGSEIIKGVLPVNIHHFNRRLKIKKWITELINEKNSKSKIIQQMHLRLINLANILYINTHLTISVTKNISPWKYLLKKIQRSHSLEHKIYIYPNERYGLIATIISNNLKQQTRFFSRLKVSIGVYKVPESFKWRFIFTFERSYDAVIFYNQKYRVCIYRQYYRSVGENYTIYYREKLLLSVHKTR